MRSREAPTQDVIAHQLCDIIVESRPALAEKIRPDTVLTADLVDSLTKIEIVIRIEDRFSIVMPDFEEIDVLTDLTVADLAAIVAKRMSVDS